MSKQHGRPLCCAFCHNPDKRCLLPVLCRPLQHLELPPSCCDRRLESACDSQNLSIAEATGCCGPAASAAPSATHNARAAAAASLPSPCNHSGRIAPGAGTTSPGAAKAGPRGAATAQSAAATTSGRPSVMVPVLSRTTAVLRPREAPRSSTEASRTRQWCLWRSRGPSSPTEPTERTPRGPSAIRPREGERPPPRRPPLATTLSHLKPGCTDTEWVAATESRGQAISPLQRRSSLSHHFLRQDPPMDESMEGTTGAERTTHAETKAPNLNVARGSRRRHAGPDEGRRPTARQ